MKYLKKFDTEADVAMAITPNVVLIDDTGDVLYNVMKGVFIQHIDGSLYTTSEWTAGGFANDQANGVAVCDIGASFVIAKSNASNSKLAWGGYGKTITDIVTSSSSSTVILDYDGAGNTTKIIEQLSGYTDSQSVVGAPAAEACAAYTFPNGVKGHLPALGEWKIAYNNKSAVNSAMSLIGGVSLGSSYYWSSTQSSANYAWYLDWNDGSAYANTKDRTYYVRAFSAL